MIESMNKLKKILVSNILEKRKRAALKIYVLLKKFKQIDLNEGCCTFILILISFYSCNFNQFNIGKFIYLLIQENYL